jgi:hypothetical protein
VSVSDKELRETYEHWIKGRRPTDWTSLPMNRGSLMGSATTGIRHARTLFPFAPQQKAGAIPCSYLAVFLLAATMDKLRGLGDNCSPFSMWAKASGRFAIS